MVLANSKINFIRPADVHQIFVGDERFYGVCKCFGNTGHRDKPFENVFFVCVLLNCALF